MAVAVVDGFEAVQVEEQQAEGHAVAAAFEGVVEPAPVLQPGQRIGHRIHGAALLGLAHRRDVRGAQHGAAGLDGEVADPQLPPAGPGAGAAVLDDTGLVTGGGECLAECGDHPGRRVCGRLVVLAWCRPPGQQFGAHARAEQRVTGWAILPCRVGVHDEAGAVDHGCGAVDGVDHRPCEQFPVTQRRRRLDLGRDILQRHHAAEHRVLPGAQLADVGAQVPVADPQDPYQLVGGRGVLVATEFGDDRRQPALILLGEGRTPASAQQVLEVVAQQGAGTLVGVDQASIRAEVEHAVGRGGEQIVDPCRHIALDRDEVADLTCGVVDRGDRHPVGVEPAVLTTVDHLAFPGTARQDGLPQAGVEGPVVLAGAEHPRGPAHGFVVGVAGGLGEGAVDVADHPVGVGDDHHRIGCIEGRHRERLIQVVATATWKRLVRLTHRDLVCRWLWTAIPPDRARVTDRGTEGRPDRLGRVYMEF